PLGYFGQLFTMPLPLALLMLAVAPAWWPAAAGAVAIRFVAAWVVCAQVLKARVPWWLIPIEDVLAFAFWGAGVFGHPIVWRGRRYRVEPYGKFQLLGS